jgi:hypothetical protein
MTAKNYYYNVSKLNPMHDLPEGVICMKEEELFQLMENYALFSWNTARDEDEKGEYAYLDFEEYLNFKEE